jgi:hypothetical protein
MAGSTPFGLIKEVPGAVKCTQEQIVAFEGIQEEAIVWSVI